MSAPLLGEQRSKWEIAGVAGYVAMALGLAIRLVLEHGRGHLERQNVWLDVFAPAAGAFVAGDDLYTLAGGFRYPPLAAALMVPFTWFGPLGGSIVWRWVMLLGLGLGVRSCMRAGFPFPLTSRERGVFWLLLTPAVAGSANIGQPNTLILGGMLWATVEALHGRNGRACVGVIGNTALKVYPFAHGLVLAALRPRLLPWLSLGLVAIATLPFLLQRPSYVYGQYAALFDLLGHEDRTHDLGTAYRDLRLLCVAIGAPIGDGTFHLLQAGCGAGVALVCVWLQRRGVAAARVFQHAVSLTICWCLLLGPATETVTYTLLGPCIFWPLLQSWRRDRLRSSWPWLHVNALYLAQHLLPSLPRSYQAAHPWTRCHLPMTTLLAGALLLGSALRDGHRAADRESAVEADASPT